MDIKNLTAPCGLGCFACAVYRGNLTEDVKAMVAGNLGLNAEDVACDGCRSEKGCSIEGVLAPRNGCKTKRCVAEKGLHNCSECGEFPCENLMPGADMADQAPHNLKAFNLATIKKVGLEEWAKGYPDTVNRYFKGKFCYGTCPKVEGEE